MREFAALLRIGLNQVYGLIERGELYACKLHGQYRIPRRELVRLRGDSEAVSVAAAALASEQMQQRCRAMSDRQFDRLVTKFFGLGLRPLRQLLREVRTGITPPQALDARMEAYVARLTPEMLAITGGDRLPVAPIHAVPK